MRFESCSFKAWMREELHRGFILSVILFIGLFAYCLVPVLLNYSRFERISEFSYHLLCENSGFVFFLVITIAICLSGAMFDYLHASDSVTALHSMPITRGKLFWSSTLAGVVLLVLPIVLIGALMLFLQGASVSGDDVGEVDRASEIFTVMQCGYWVWRNAVVGIFALALSNLAAVVTGSRTIHILTAIFFNVVLFAIDVVINLVSGMFVYGLCNSFISHYAVYYHPAAYIMRQFNLMETSNVSMSDAVRTGSISMLIYLLIALAIMILSLAVYRRVKLEEVPGACLFPVVADILAIVLSVLFASGTAMLITEVAVINSDDPMQDSRMPFLLIFAAMSIIWFLVFRMIADGTARIIHRRTAKKFAAYVVIAALFCAFTVYDVGGIGERVPSESSLSSVRIECTNLFGCVNSPDLREKDDIEKVLALQKALLDTKDIESSQNASEGSVSFYFGKESGREIMRCYSVYMDEGYQPVEKAFRDLFADSECREIWRLNPDGINGVYRISDDGNQEYLEISASDVKGFAKAYNADIDSFGKDGWKKAWGMSEDTICSLDIDSEYGYIALEITKDFKHTVAFLKKKGKI